MSQFYKAKKETQTADSTVEDESAAQATARFIYSCQGDLNECDKNVPFPFANWKLREVNQYKG